MTVELEPYSGQWWVLNEAGNVVAKFGSKTEAESFIDEQEARCTAT